MLILFDFLRQIYPKQPVLEQEVALIFHQLFFVNSHPLFVTAII